MSTQRMRASDAEREQVAQVLRAAMTEGRLSLEDGEERLGKVYAAAYRDELTPLTTDLPGGGWHALRDTPEARRQAGRFVRGRIGVALVVAAVLVGVWALSGAGFFWPLIPLLFIGLFAFRCFGWRHRYGWRHGHGGQHGYGWRHGYGSDESARPVQDGPPWTRR